MWRHWENNIWILQLSMLSVCSCLFQLAAGFLHFTSWTVRYWFPVRSRTFNLLLIAVKFASLLSVFIVFLCSSLSLPFSSNSWLGKLFFLSDYNVCVMVSTFLYAEFMCVICWWLSFVYVQDRDVQDKTYKTEAGWISLFTVARPLLQKTD